MILSLALATMLSAPFDYTSRYLTMRDGVRIAIDVYVPKSIPAGTRVPTIILQTRYYRSHRVMQPFQTFWGGYLEPMIGKFAKRGYAFVVVDARGSGASFGTREMEWGPEEIKDGAEVVNWIVAQAWSNGKVGSTGGSYDGVTAEMLLSNMHPAVIAVAPRSAMYDVYADIAFPGGVKFGPFVDFWGRMTAAQDRGDFNSMLPWFPKLVYRGVKPVQGDSGEALLAEAILEHRKNYNMPELVGKQEFRGETPLVELMSAYSRADAIRRSGGTILSIDGWYDGAMVNSAIKRFLTVRTPESRLLIGPWNHQQDNLSPFAKRLDDFSTITELFSFFDERLKGERPARPVAPVRYYTVGEERWKESPTWPPPGTTTMDLFFDDRHSLSRNRPAQADAVDRYQVNFATGSGQETRWNSITELDWKHSLPKDRDERDRLLLTYDSAPIDKEMEVTGHPVVTLHMASSEPDGAVFVYLEDVEESGKINYVTEGVLRLIHRELSKTPAPYVFPMPYRAFTKAESRPMVPGQVATVSFDLLPISYLFKRGHSIRIAIAGADIDHFTQIGVRPPLYSIHRDAALSSRISLPVMPR